MATKTMDFGNTELGQLIAQAADAFERDNVGITVTPEARTALLIPALPHLSRISNELATGGKTLDSLQMDVTTILENAKEFAARGIIDEKAIKKSIKKFCPYLMWC